MSATSYVQGQAGRLEVRLIEAQTQPSQNLAVICHPHPLFGGTMDNKVVTTIMRTFKEQGMACVSFNFRGVGHSEGQHDNGQGEVDDLLSVLTWAIEQTQATQLYLAGFSFGSYIAAASVARLTSVNIHLKKLVLVAPPVHHYAFNALTLPIQQTLVIQGDADEVVPAAQVFAWAAQQQLLIVNFAGCGHFFHGRLVELRQTLLESLV